MTDTHETAPLKPCPFCGGEAKAGHRTEFVKPHRDFFWVGCSKCLVKTQWYSSESSAASVWNTRPSPHGAGDELEEVAREIVKDGVRSSMFPFVSVSNSLITRLTAALPKEATSNDG